MTGPSPRGGAGGGWVVPAYGAGQQPLGWNDVLKQLQERRALHGTPEAVCISALPAAAGGPAGTRFPRLTLQTDGGLDCACATVKPPFMEGLLLGSVRSASCPECRAGGLGHRAVQVRLVGPRLLLQLQTGTEALAAPPQPCGGSHAQCFAALCAAPMRLGRACSVSRNPVWPEAFTITARLDGHEHHHSLELVAHKRDAEAWRRSFEDAQMLGRCRCAESQHALASCPPGMQTVESVLSPAALEQDPRGSRSLSHTPEGSPRVDLFAADEQSPVSSFSVRRITKLNLETSFYTWLKTTLAGKKKIVQGGAWRRVQEEEEEEEEEEEDGEEEEPEQDSRASESDEEAHLLPPSASTPGSNVVPVLSFVGVVDGINAHTGREGHAELEASATDDGGPTAETPFCPTSLFWGFLHWHKAISLMIQAETGLVLRCFMEWRELSLGLYSANGPSQDTGGMVAEDLAHDAGSAVAVSGKPMEPNTTPLLKQPILEQYPAGATPLHSTSDNRALGSPTCSEAPRGFARAVEANPTPLLKHAISGQYPLSSGKKITMNVCDRCEVYLTAMNKT